MPEKDYYKILLEKYYPIHFFATFRAHELYNLEPYINLLEPPILDLGCGDGFIVNVLFNKKLKYGVDISENVLEIAQKNDSYNEVFCASGHNLPFADNSIGGVFSNCVLEHIPDMQNLFKEISRVLKPGGYFIASCNNTNYYEEDQAYKFIKHTGNNELLEKMIDKENVLHNHVSVYNQDYYKKLSADNSLTLEKCVHYSPPEITSFVSLWDTLSKYRKKSKKDFKSLSFLERVLFYSYQENLVKLMTLKYLKGLNPLSVLVFLLKNNLINAISIKKLFNASYETDIELMDKLKPYEVLATLLKKPDAINYYDNLNHDGFLIDYLEEKFQEEKKQEYVNFWYDKYKSAVYSRYCDNQGLAQILVIKKV